MCIHFVSSASTRKNFGLDVEFFRFFLFLELHVGRNFGNGDAREIRRKEGFNWGFSKGEALLDNKEDFDRGRC